MLVIAVVFILASYSIILAANHFLASRGNPAFVILPTPGMWLVFPLFGALCVPYYAALQVWKRFDPRQVVKYEAWENRNAHFNATRAMQMIILCIELPIGIATALAIPIHTAFSDAGIRIGHFGTLRPSNHPYSDVVRVILTDGYRSRNGFFNYCPALILYFSDGTRWSSASNRDCRPLDERATSFVQDKAHIQAQHIEVLPLSALLGNTSVSSDQTNRTH